MKCTKCGSDAVMKDGDWLTCLNCGNVMFDTRRPEETAAEISPTKLLEQMEAGSFAREHVFYICLLYTSPSPRDRG